MTGPDDAASRLTISLFGSFEVRRNGEFIPQVRARKGHIILALLALGHNREIKRPWLASTLWDESEEPQALAYLRNSLKELRRNLGAAADCLISPTPHTLALDPSRVDNDVAAFDAAIARGDSASLKLGVELYRGSLLKGWLEDWALEERQVREQQYLRTLEKLATQTREQGEHAEAEYYLRRAIAVDATRETAQRALMEVLAASGNHAAATQVYQELRRFLHREMDAEPAPETTALSREIRVEARRRASTLGRPDDAARPAALSRMPSPPVPRTTTFLFTDIEGSTQLWEQHPEAMRQALARHDALLHQAIEAHGGSVFKTVGDAFCAAFGTAQGAVAAAADAQQALARESWGKCGPLRVRMAMHTGVADEHDDDFFGPPLNRVARLLAAGYGGQTLLSLTTAELVRDYLPEGAVLQDLGLQRLRDLQRPEHTFQLLHRDLPAQFPALKSLDTLPNNLPVQFTRFVGREREIDELRRLLTGVCLLTLTGPAGCGKTRLGLHVAADLMEHFSGGVYFVSMASIRDPELVPSAIAQTLAVREVGGRPALTSLKEHLREKQVLLLLDNFEQVVAAARLVLELLSACPRLKIMVTSRESLHVRGEHEFPVPALAAPNTKRLPPVETLAEYAAVELFVERAQAVKPDFALSEENALAVAEICTRLDGLPLAIELAAARIKLLPPPAMLARLQSRLRLLTGGAQDLPERQRTLRSALDWGYELLSPEEQALFRRLAVFAGGWTLQAAAEVCHAAGAVQIDLLDGLGLLVDKSLVLLDDTGESDTRFHMLGTLREYGLDRLAACGELEVTHGSYGAFLRALVEEAEPKMRGPEQTRVLAQIEAEHDNCRAALDWSVSAGDAESALRMTAALWRFWHVRGHLHEGRRRLERALAMSGGSARTRARALFAAGALAHDQGDFSQAAALHGESLAIACECGDRETVALTLNNLGNVALDRGNSEEAVSRYQAALGLWQEMGNRQGSAVVLNNLGGVAEDRGDYAQARAYYEESLALKRELGDPRGIANSLNNLGNLALRQGDHHRAATLLQESLALFRELEDSYGIAMSLDNLARLANSKGDLPRAAALHRECLTVCRTLENRAAIASAMEGLAHVEAASGRPIQAAPLYGAAAAMREETGAPLPENERADYARRIGEARATADETAWQAAWARGASMSLPDAIDFAIEGGAAPPPGDGLSGDKVTAEHPNAQRPNT